eukprot:gene10336-10493_t
MAKKKGARSASNADDEERQLQTEQTVEAGQQEQQEQAGPIVRDVDLMTEEELRTELQAARTEIERLKKDLAAKDAELATKEQSSDVIKAVQPQEMQELQQKLLHLRKEQQSADAARDKAWKQLKAVVEEISNLANPDYLQSLQIKSSQE